MPTLDPYFPPWLQVSRAVSFFEPSHLLRPAIVQQAVAGVGLPCSRSASMGSMGTHPAAPASHSQQAPLQPLQQQQQRVQSYQHSVFPAELLLVQHRSMQDPRAANQAAATAATGADADAPYCPNHHKRYLDLY